MLKFKTTYNVEEIAQDVKNKISCQIVEHLAKEISRELDCEKVEYHSANIVENAIDTNIPLRYNPPTEKEKR